MKTRSLFLAFAGLGLFACTNEDLSQSQFPEGNGAVTVKIVSPTVSRAIGAGHSSDVKVTPVGNVSITLTSDQDDQTIVLTASDWAEGKIVKFWNVTNPKSVTVVMNGGKSEYTIGDKVETDALQSVENIPAYGETSTFTLSSETESPDFESPYQSGAKAEDESKVYQMYNATVKMHIPMSRLEVSGIQHVVTDVDGHDEESCEYGVLTIEGVYLDNVYADGTGVKYSEEGYSNPTITPTDYKYVPIEDNQYGTGIEAVLKDAIPEGEKDFLTVNASWPSNNNVFGYNFFGAAGDNMPKFKIYFSASTSVNPDNPLPAPRYAMITSYKNENGPITEFKPGTIYRITSAKLTDENIIGDENGNTMYGVEVTVEEAVWTPVTIEAEWAK